MLGSAESERRANSWRNSRGVSPIPVLPRPAQDELADALAVPYDTARGWSSGKTDPSPENRQALAGFMRQHAKQLLEAADSLED